MHFCADGCFSTSQMYTAFTYFYSVGDKLRVLSASVPSDMSFSLYDCPVLDMFPPVTADEVTRVVSDLYVAMAHI